MITLAGAGWIGWHLFPVFGCHVLPLPAFSSPSPVHPRRIGVVQTNSAPYAHSVSLFIVLQKLGRALRPLATPATELTAIISVHRASARFPGPAGHRDGVPHQTVVLGPHGDSLRPVGGLTPLLGRAVLQGEAVVGQQGCRGRRFDFVRVRGQEVLLQVQRAAAHVGEVAELAAKVLCVPLAVRGLAANPDERPSHCHLSSGRDKQRSVGKTRLRDSCIMSFPLSTVPFTDNMSYFDPADQTFLSASVK